MGDVAITYKVMPDGLEVNLHELKDKLSSELGQMCKINGIEEQPVAFGLKALVIQVVIKDSEGIVDKLESMIMNIPGVQNADVIEMGLV